MPTRSLEAPDDMVASSATLANRSRLRKPAPGAGFPYRPRSSSHEIDGSEMALEPSTKCAY